MDAQLGGNIGTAILSLAPPQAGSRPRHRMLVLSDRSRALARSLGRHSDQSQRGSSRSPRHDGTLRRGEGTSRRRRASRTAPPSSASTTTGAAAIADRLEQCRQARGADFGAAARWPTAFMSSSETHHARGRRHRIRRLPSIGGIGSLRGAAQCAERRLRRGRRAGARPRPAAIQAGLRSFPGLAHRMEEVGRRGAVLFVNDSKATNADSDGAGAGLLRRHFLDRRRQAEDRRHRDACGNFFRASARPI